MPAETLRMLLARLREASQQNNVYLDEVIPAVLALGEAVLALSVPPASKPSATSKK